MGFRFWKRIKIAPGVTLNLCKSGASLSFGGRGARFTLGPRGRQVTVGLPGSGLFYTTRLPPIPRRARLSGRFFQRLAPADDEKALVDGCRELALGDEGRALQLLEQAAHLADGAFLAGFLQLKHRRLEEAASHLNTAAEKHRSLGSCFSRYGISPTMVLPITDEIAVPVEANLRGVLLGLVEIYQLQERHREAMACLERLRRLEPDDVLVKLSIGELLWESRPGDPDRCRKVVQLAEGVDNDTAVHAALLLYKARALRELGLLEAARETLTRALRRKKGRPPELLRALRYERALVYQDLDKPKQARKDLEKLYAEDPNDEDVAVRLGVAPAEPAGP